MSNSKGLVIYLQYNRILFDRSREKNQFSVNFVHFRGQRVVLVLVTIVTLRPLIKGSYNNGMEALGEIFTWT